MAASRERTPVADARGYAKRARVEHLTGGGTTGNEHLTTLVGATLIVLLAVIGLTIVRIGQLLFGAHVRGDAAHRAGAVEAVEHRLRFARYYTRNPRYVQKGPPELAVARARADGGALNAGRVRQRRRAPVRGGLGARNVAPDPQGQLLRVGRVYRGPCAWPSTRRCRRCYARTTAATPTTTTRRATTSPAARVVCSRSARPGGRGGAGDSRDPGVRSLAERHGPVSPPPLDRDADAHQSYP